MVVKRTVVARMELRIPGLRCLNYAYWSTTSLLTIFYIGSTECSSLTSISLVPSMLERLVKSCDYHEISCDLYRHTLTEWSLGIGHAGSINTVKWSTREEGLTSGCTGLV